jgi:hypothetical protein
LFVEPLAFSSGELVLPANYVPTVDRAVLKAHELTAERFAAVSVGA